MLEDTLKSMSEDCKLLVNDMQGMLHEFATGDKASRKSIEPITRLRKTTEDLKEAEATDPKIQFIKDKLSDIFGG